MKAKTKKIQTPVDTDGQPLTTVSALRAVREDIKGMETHSVDGVIVLVPKADVLDILQDHIEYALNPDE